ncbi:MAG: ATP-binding protein [Candidatus Auribacterota bacterium]|jgi:PAS domain S-box-containing protein|nr:ATP-binding protein [Candidatus Auribacterota bacterium]
MNKLLKRQLKKFLGSEIPPNGYESLFEAISDAYDAFDSDRQLMERSFDMSSQEFNEVNRKLQREIEQHTITEQKLRESEQQLRDMFDEHSSIMLLIDTQNGVIVDANKSAQKFYGYDHQQLLNMSIYDINIMKKETLRHLINDVAAFKENCFVVEHKLSTGEIREVEVHSTPISINGKILLFSIIHDVTERRQIQEELIKTRKLESIGILAGGIAHDFNNLLTAIMGNISLARLDINDSEHDLLALLKNAENASVRARELSQQLLTFSKGGAPLKRTTSIKSIIEDSANFCLKGAKVKCEFHIDDNLYPVNVDKGQISQVVHNMIINANQAMPDSGIIEVSCSNINLKPVNKPRLPAGKYIVITIRDHGVGIPPENLNKIFDPYFTTKEQGNGLGLATSYSIIKKHEGDIKVESEPGKGTCFYIYLPASESNIEAEQPAKSDLIGGKGRILIMDDDDAVKNVFGQFLTRLGYQPSFASDGSEAIEMYRYAVEENNPFDMVIMDLIIPGGMGGKETIEQISRIDPDVKAVVASGYSNDPILSEFTRYGFCAAIGKPFNISDLSSILHSVINGAQLG